MQNLDKNTISYGTRKLQTFTNSYVRIILKIIRSNYVLIQDVWQSTVKRQLEPNWNEGNG